jgi:hypothetical protein
MPSGDRLISSPDGKIVRRKLPERENAGRDGRFELSLYENKQNIKVGLILISPGGATVAILSLRGAVATRQSKYSNNLVVYPAFRLPRFTCNDDQIRNIQINPSSAPTRYRCQDLRENRRRYIHHPDPVHLQTVWSHAAPAG